MFTPLLIVQPCVDDIVPSAHGAHGVLREKTLRVSNLEALS